MAASNQVSTFLYLILIFITTLKYIITKTITKITKYKNTTVKQLNSNGKKNNTFHLCNLGPLSTAAPIGTKLSNL